MRSALPVNEIFETLQGEAEFTGQPSVFIRLQSCDVGCPWCDTKHTWAAPDQTRQITVVDMLRKTEDAPTFAYVSTEILLGLLKDHFNAKHIVFTGGEPAIYDLKDLTKDLIDRGYTVQLETSGTYQIRIDDRAWVTCSPKFDMPGGRSVLMEAIMRADEIKLPVGKPAHVEQLALFLQSVILRRRDSVWLQPLSTSPKATRVCLEEAAKRGWRVSLQIHKFAGLR